MTTVKKLIDDLSKLNPDTEVQIMAAHYNHSILVVVDERKDCDGPYIVCELHTMEEE